MNRNWRERIQREIEGLRKGKSHDQEENDTLPYFVTMKECQFVPDDGKCEISFLVSLDTDVVQESGKLVLQRAALSRVVEFTIDASIKVGSKGSTTKLSKSYPYFEPKITLTSGAEFFPVLSNISNGDLLKYGKEHWKQSVSICDVAISIGSKIRQSIRCGHLCLALEKKIMKNTIERLDLEDKLRDLTKLRDLVKTAEEQNKGKEESIETEEGMKQRNLMEPRGKSTTDEKSYPLSLTNEPDDTMFELSIRTKKVDTEDEKREEIVHNSLKRSGLSGELTRLIKLREIIKTVEEQNEEKEGENETEEETRRRKLSELRGMLTKAEREETNSFNSNLALEDTSGEEQSLFNSLEMEIGDSMLGLSAIPEEGETDDDSGKSLLRNASIEKTQSASNDVEVGDIINLDENPFNKTRGLFPCKLTKRPENNISSRLKTEEVLKVRLFSPLVHFVAVIQASHECF